MGRRVAPFYVTDRLPAYRPHLLLLCLDFNDGKVHAAEVLDPEESAEDAARKLAGAVGLGAGAAPTVRVDAEVLAAALRALLPPGASVNVGPTPEVDVVVEAMGDSETGLGNVGEPDYLEGGSVAEPSVRRFFEAAATLYRLVPWKKVRSDSQLLGLEAAAAGFPAGCVGVMGTLGETLGFSLYESVADFRSLSRLADEERFSGVGIRPTPGVPLFAVNFDAAADLPAPMRRQVKQNRWPVPGSKGYPSILRLDPDGVRRPLTSDDYELAADCAAALAAFFTEHVHVFDEEDPRPVTVIHPLLGGAGASNLELLAPCPGIDWHWLDGTGVDAVRDEDAQAIIADHVAFLRAGGATEAEGDEAGFLLDQVFAFKTQVLDEPPLGWTAEQVEDFLLEYFPPHVPLDGAAARRAPAQLAAFFTWLGTEGVVEVGNAETIVGSIAAARPEFERRALDRARWRPGKTIVVAMQEEGVDPGDSKAVNDFMARHNERLRRDPDALPARVRWSPGPGEAAPALAEPCPCGSGRRYGKCCRRR